MFQAITILGFIGCVATLAYGIRNGLNVKVLISSIVVVGMMVFGMSKILKPVQNQTIREAKTVLTVKQAKKVFNNNSSNDDVLNALSGKEVRQGKNKYIINIKKGGFLQSNNISFEPVN